MAFLQPDRIRHEYGLEIKEKIIPWGAVWPKASGGYAKGDKYKADRKLSNGTGQPQHITVHNTPNISHAAGTTDAEQYVRATWPNANMRDVRVHYYIDGVDCWQMLWEDEVGWHAADGNGPGNETSIAIEIIMAGNGSATDKAAESRGALLAAILLYRHGLGIDRLTTHNRWSGKNCPAYILPHWDAFVAQVSAYLANIKVANAALAPSTIAVGSLVSIAPSATYYSGQKIPAWVKNTKWYVSQIKGDRAIIGKDVSGQYAIASPVNVAYLTPAGAAAPVATIKVGSTVRVKAGAKTYDGQRLASFVSKRNHKVKQINGNRVVITYWGIVIAAVNIRDLTLV